MKVSVAAIVFWPLSRCDFIMNRSCYLLFRLHYWFNIVCESIQEAQSNGDSVTVDILILVLQKFKENRVVSREL